VSVERACELLERVSASGGGITLQELARESPTSKSTTHRYVSTMLGLGLLRRDEGNRLHPGVKLLALAGAYVLDEDLRGVAASHLRELAELTQETAHLAVPSGDEMVYVDKVETPRAVRLVSQIGGRVPMHATAIGKGVLAYLPEERRRVLVERASKLTPHTLVGEELVDAVAAVRRCGFAIDDEENEIGVRCLAAPILTEGAEPVGAIGVSAPAARLSLEHCEELAPAVVGAAREIARRLGHERPPLEAEPAPALVGAHRRAKGA
jgi:IclR family acetate operon transcriptional repressor